MLNFQKVTFEITGVAELLMHNRQLADPTNRFARDMKEITSKKKKTDADHEQLKRLEFMGGLYIDEAGPYVPSEWIDSMIRDGAKAYKQGKLMTAGVLPSEDRAYLLYKGPKTTSELFEEPSFVDVRGVRVGQSVVMRTRPKFPQGWRLKFSVNVNVDVVQPQDVERAIDAAGQVVGLGDYRPKYGRFIIENVDVEGKKGKRNGK